MKKEIPVVMLGVLLVLCSISSASQVYSNTFDTDNSLNDFCIFGNPLPSWDTVELSQLKLHPSISGPAAPGSLMLDASSFGDNFKTVLSQNNGTVSWSFNLSYQDQEVGGYTYNNRFAFVLASTKGNPWDIAAHGYCFTGGDRLGGQMGLWRFDYGLGGGQRPLIDIQDGLDVLPEKGSFKITYDPETNIWKLFGEIGTDYVNAENVTSLLGTVVNGTYTSTITPYFGFTGNNPGIDYFDNVTVCVVPEPFTLALFGFGGLFLRRRTRGHSNFLLKA